MVQITLGHNGLTQIQRNDTDLKIPIQPLGHYDLTQIQRDYKISYHNLSHFVYYGLTQIQSISHWVILNFAQYD